MLLIRPAAAHRVTVFGSTRNSAATSPGVSRRSPVSTTPSLRRTKVRDPGPFGRRALPWDVRPLQHRHGAMSDKR